MSYGNNVNSPQGLVPSQYLNGVTYNGQPNPYLLASGYDTAIFSGDPVTFDNTGSIVIGAANGPWVGVFGGVKYTDANGNYQFSKNWVANTETKGDAPAQALIYDDPWILFDIQASNSTAGNKYLIQANMGNNAAVVIGTGNTFNGLSTTYLDVNTILTTAALPLKMIRFTPRPGNGPGSATAQYNNALVLINNHIYKGGTGTAGV
jgi:hypothetical protein